MAFKVSTKPDPGEAPGIYHAEVARAEEKYSKKDDPMLVVHFVALDFKKKKLCTDYIMLAGGGKGMGIGKLKNLGIDMAADEVEVSAESVTGKRCYLNLVNEVFDGQTRLKVGKMDKDDIGYFPESSPPSAYMKPEESDDPFDVDAPF